MVYLGKKLFYQYKMPKKPKKSITVIVKYFTILLFYCILDQINSALVVKRFSFKNHNNPKLLNGSVCFLALY